MLRSINNPFHSEDLMLMDIHIDTADECPVITYVYIRPKEKKEIRKTYYAHNMSISMERKNPFTKQFLCDSEINLNGMHLISEEIKDI